MTINCCICGDSTTLSERVIHHCHLTGKVFGVAHSSCNLKGTSTSYLPIFFHNLSRSDAHHIIKNLTLLSVEKLSAISRTDETYIFLAFLFLSGLIIQRIIKMQQLQTTSDFSIVSSSCLKV